MFYQGLLGLILNIKTVTIVGRVITIWEAIQKRSYEPIYKTHTKIEAERLKATTSAISKFYTCPPGCRFIGCTQIMLKIRYIF